MKRKMIALMSMLTLGWSSMAAQPNYGWSDPVSDTVIVEVNGSKIIIQTDEIAEDMARIQAELTAVAQNMVEVAGRLANAESDEEKAQLEAEMAKLEAEMERI